MTRLRGRRDHLDVIAVREHLASPPLPGGAERGVDVTRRRDLEALHPAGERALVLGLDEQVDVGALQRDVHDAKPLAQGRRDRRVAHRLVHPAPPQAAYRRRDPQHHVERVVRLEVRPGRMALEGARPLRPATRAAALATAAEQVARDMPLPPTCRRRRPHDQRIRTAVSVVN